MRSRRLAPLLLMLLLAGCGGGAHGDGLILLASQREAGFLDANGGYGLYAARPDGHGLRRLTRPGEWLALSGGYKSSFSASPDGRRVAYAAHDGWIRIVGFDGKGRERVARGLAVAWSPHGDRLAVARGPRGAVVVDLDGRVQRRLASGEVDAAPSWSPDGKQLAVVVSKDTTGTVGALLVVDSDGHVTRVADNAEATEAALWSRGGKIAYLAETRGVESLVVAREDGTRRRVAARDVMFGFAWSPDGRRLAYTGPGTNSQGSPNDVWTVGADGSDRLRLTRMPPQTGLAAGLGATRPTWSPDGKRIAFLRARVRVSLGHDVAVVPAAGGAVTAATHAFPEGGDDNTPLWTRGAVPRTAPPATVAVRAHVLSTERPVCTFGGGSTLVLFSEVGYEECPGFFAWSPKTGIRRPVDSRCSYAYGLVVAGRRTAWICPNQGFYTLVGSAGGRSRVVWNGEPVGKAQPPPDAPDDLVSDGRSLIVYDRRVHSATKPPPTGLWRLDGLRPVPIPRTERLEPLAAGNNLIAARGVGAVVLLRPNGRRVGLVPGDASEAAFDRNRLALHRGGRVDVYDVRSGRRLARRPLLRGDGPPPVLVGIAGDRAAYTAGIALHLVRLSDGRDVILRLPRIGGELYARLDRGGLVYGYSAAYSAKAGRVGFVATADLPLR